MSTTYQALDQQFAVATGSNVNSGTGTSTFDYPPTATLNLVITSNPEDPDPDSFNLGATYDIVFEGQGGTTLEDAVVIRSDALPEGGHVVVFEGVNSLGEVVQVVWTPDFNLEGWYYDNFVNGTSPGFYTTDQSSTTQYTFVCFEADTPIETPSGPRAAGALGRGDRVRTLGGGAATIEWAGSRPVRFTGEAAQMHPVLIRAGALGPGLPGRDLVLSPQHRVLLSGAALAAATGCAEVLVPAIALTALRGVRVMKGRTGIRYANFMCGAHEVVLAAGLACETFYPGVQALRMLPPWERATLRRLYPGIESDPATAYGRHARPVLTVRQTRDILSTAEIGRDLSGLRAARSRALIAAVD